MKVLQKNKAIELRKTGKSIKEIAKLLGVSKSSVSVWVRSVVISEKTKRALFLRGWTSGAIENRRKSRLSNEKQKRSIVVESATKDFNNVSDKELKIIGTMLYWAEGGKTKRGSVRFANSDPLLIKIMMKFFREVCFVSDEKFRGHIHTHSHLNVRTAEKYWSDITFIPQKHFFKTYSKPSVASKNKKDSLPYGTLDVYICDTKLFLTIMGWIKKISLLTVKEYKEGGNYF